MYLPRGKEKQQPLQLFALLPSSHSAWFKKTIAAAAAGAVGAAVLLEELYDTKVFVSRLSTSFTCGRMTVTGRAKYYFYIWNLKGLIFPSRSKPTR